jgi:hypothetical protein
VLSPEPELTEYLARDACESLVDDLDVDAL